MKRTMYFLMVSGLVLLVACTSKKPTYNPHECISEDDQAKFLKEMVRYASKLPPQATKATRFNPEFDWYYDRAIAECRIIFCQLNAQDSTYQLLVGRQARSIDPMEEGIAVRMKLAKQGGLDLYEEVFRTWKMPADTLDKRGKFLFERMIKNEDLTIYYSRFQKDRFIEFPDDRFKFDIENRKWIDRELDTLQIN